MCAKLVRYFTNSCKQKHYFYGVQYIAWHKNMTANQDTDTVDNASL